jgi:hypothetical protein
MPRTSDVSWAPRRPSSMSTRTTIHIRPGRRVQSPADGMVKQRSVQEKRFSNPLPERTVATVYSPQRRRISPTAPSTRSSGTRRPESRRRSGSITRWVTLSARGSTITRLTLPTVPLYVPRGITPVLLRRPAHWPEAPIAREKPTYWDHPTRPLTRVSALVTSLSRVSGTEKGSSVSTTRSARFPTSSDPRSFSIPHP